MRILYLSQLLPYPPDAGPKVRSYYVLRYLAQNHEVTLVAFTRPDDRPEAIDHLKEFCAAVHTVPMLRSRRADLQALFAALLTNQSFIIRRDQVPEMQARVDFEIRDSQFDIIHADQLWMAQYALLAQRNLQPATGNFQLILDEHNACFQIFQRLARGEPNPFKRLFLEREWRSLRRYEAGACARFDTVVTVTQEDRTTLEGLVREVRIQRQESKDDERADTSQKFEIRSPRFFTLPICVDTTEVQPVSPVGDSQNVLHLGTMFWLPNVEGVLWFAREVWPLVKAQIPGASFTIAGKNPPPEVKQLAGDSGLGNPAQIPGLDIRVTGYIPDPQPYLAAAGAFIVPLLSGGGMRVKIVDAWRWGLPVVSTTIGAEGLDYHDGKHLLIADTPTAFAQAVVRALTDQTFNLRLRQNGRAWVEERYEWRKIYQAWDAIYSVES